MSMIVPLIILGGGSLVTYKGYKAFKGAGNKILGAPGNMFGSFVGDIAKSIPSLPSIETFTKIRIPEIDIPDLVPKIDIPDVKHLKFPKTPKLPKLPIPKIKKPNIEIPRMPWDKRKSEEPRILTKPEKEANLKKMNINRLKMLRRSKNNLATIETLKSWRKDRKQTMFFGVGADDLKKIFGEAAYWKVFPKPTFKSSNFHMRR